MIKSIKSFRLSLGIFLGVSLLSIPVLGQNPNPPNAQSPVQLPLSLADAVFDYYRPKIIPRTLTASEKAEIPRLYAQFVGPSDNESTYRNIANYYVNYDSASNLAKGPHSALLRLMQLGESGDKDAMIAVRDALVFGWGTGPMLNNLTKSGQQTVEIGGEVSEGVRLALIGHWTAQIWYRFGPERRLGAAMGMKACLIPFKNPINANWRGDYQPRGTGAPAKTLALDCGFSFLYPASFRRAGANQKSWERNGRTNSYFETQGELIANWVRVGGQPDFRVTEFRPTIGDEAFEAERYRKLLVNVGYTRMNFGGESGYKLTKGEWAWVNDYRARTGETFHWGNAVYRIGNIATFAESQRIKEAKKLAEDKLKSPDFETDEERKARRRFEWDQALRSGTMFSGPLPSAGVTVRNYDRNGNYLGSTVTTRGEAVLSGAKPQ